MAFHAIKAGEGDVFILPPASRPSRFQSGTVGPHPGTPRTRSFADAQVRTED